MTAAAEIHRNHALYNRELAETDIDEDAKKHLHEMAAMFERLAGEDFGPAGFGESTGPLVF